MPPTSDKKSMANQKVDMTEVENALLRNNDYLVDKMTKTIKDEVSSVRTQMSEHSTVVLAQMTEIAQKVGSNSTEITNLKIDANSQKEQLKGLNAKIATVGVIGSTVGGFIVFLINNFRG